MSATTKNFFVLVNFLLLVGYLNFEYIAETKENSIINLFCMQNFKEEMLKGKINYDKEIAKETCDCYLEEFINTKSHQTAIDKCKLETMKKINL